MVAFSIKVWRIYSYKKIIRTNILIWTNIQIWEYHTNMIWTKSIFKSSWFRAPHELDFLFTKGFCHFSVSRHVSRNRKNNKIHWNFFVVFLILDSFHIQECPDSGKTTKSFGKDGKLKQSWHNKGKAILFVY